MGSAVNRSPGGCCCGAGTPVTPPTPVYVPGCTCAAIPATLYFSAPPGPGCAQYFPIFSDTLTYQVTPPQFVRAGVAGQRPADMAWWGAATFPNASGSGGPGSYYANCNLGRFTIGACYSAGNGAIYPQAGGLWTWGFGGTNPPGYAPNTCSPFYLDAGSQGSGVNISCHAVISG